MITISIYTLPSVSLNIAVAMLVGLALIRVTRWFLDILP